MRYAIVDSSSVVVNLVLWDGVTPWTPPEGCIAVHLEPDEWCNMGCIYTPGEIPRFSNPPELME